MVLELLLLLLQLVGYLKTSTLTKTTSFAIKTLEKFGEGHYCRKEKIKFCCEGRRAKVSFRSRSSRPFALSGLITQVRWQTTCATLLCLKFLRKIASAGGKEGLKASSELLLLLLLQPDPFLLFVWVNLSSVGKTTTFGRNFGRKGREGKGRSVRVERV